MGQKIEKQIYFGSKDEVKESVKLDSISTLITDGIHSTPTYSNSGIIPFINGNNISNNTILIDSKTKYISQDEWKQYKQKHNEKSIVISLNGTVGSVGLRGEGNFLFGKSLGYINASKEVVNKYLMYTLESENVQKKLMAELTGSTIKNLSLQSIKSLKIQLPSYNEQLKIQTTLSQIDKLIEVNEKRKELYADIFWL